MRFEEINHNNNKGTSIEEALVNAIIFQEKVKNNEIKKEFYDFIKALYLNLENFHSVRLYSKWNPYDLKNARLIIEYLNWQTRFHRTNINTIDGPQALFFELGWKSNVWNKIFLYTREKHFLNKSFLEYIKENKKNFLISVRKDSDFLNDLKFLGNQTGLERIWLKKNEIMNLNASYRIQKENAPL